MATNTRGNHKNQTDLADAAAKLAAKPPVTAEDVEAQIRAKMGDKAPASTPTPANDAIPTRKGRMRRPRRTVIYGPPGVGKTTLGADATSDPAASDVIMIDIDNGSESLSVERYMFRPEDEYRGHVPRTLEEFIGGIRKLREGRHPYRRVVIDQLDRLELLTLRYICKRDAAAEGKDALHSLESYGYGKGKQILLDQMRVVLNELDGLIARGIDVLILAHSATKKFNNPNGPDYDRFVLKCNELVAGYVYEWADEVGFLHFDDRTERADGKRGKSKGTTTGRRIVEFDHSAAWDAKARLPLPKSVQVGSANPWEFYRAALDSAYKMTPAELRGEIGAELERIGDAELAAKVDVEVKKVGDNLDKLTAYMQDLRRRPAIEKPTDTADTITSDGGL
jgi:hypothetical protein